ncbi:sensor histidine kinase [Paenibacillus alvei]|uniref:sensor histidine kinase n=1 Tax=Paenibacillus alvei TaxID=44250 RepID=UPI0018CC9F76|nr:HAMP domain-containing sensor histidine kinase [Paenibacillus alvei]MBG9737569.1 histidine kinase [Paenibacillus alvei]MBG9747260.1 histidine kinase [Paenibacillus alvei]MCY9581257.1 HAMP domain-containing histidine kinase [Paenibacillus alvei]MCY9584453.1 HAMP domain-containing histidine kinase [Paenibacillus alvei]
MDDIIRIIRRFTGITFAIFAGIVALNLAMLGVFVFKEINDGQSPQHVVEYVANHLQRMGKTHALDASSRQMLEGTEAWAMLLDKGGQVIWDYKLPGEVPRSYSLTEVAKFTRHFLREYPVFVWEHTDGLVVLGYPKDSYAKYHFYFLVPWIRSLPQRALFLLLGNIVLGCVLAIIIGTRLVRSLKPLTGVVHALGKEEAVRAEEKGIFGNLARSINDTSEMLRERQEALRTRNEARSNWIAGISHDIRTPLSMILGYASALEEHAEVPEEQRQQAAIIRKQGEKLRSLVSDLNLVSKLEYEMQPLNMAPIRLAALARQVAADFLNQGLDDRYTIDLQIKKEPIQAEVDRKLMLRAITNLVQNCIDHNPDGCGISLLVNQSTDGSACQFTVMDNGVGIQDEALEDLLKLPYSAERQHLRQNGHGLGLPMVARIAEAHRGHLLLESDTGQGMCATIELPSCSAKEAKLS